MRIVRIICGPDPPIEIVSRFSWHNTHLFLHVITHPKTTRLLPNEPRFMRYKCPSMHFCLIFCYVFKSIMYFYTAHYIQFHSPRLDTLSLAKFTASTAPKTLRNKIFIIPWRETIFLFAMHASRACLVKKFFRRELFLIHTQPR